MSNERVAWLFKLVKALGLWVALALPAGTAAAAQEAGEKLELRQPPSGGIIKVAASPNILSLTVRGTNHSIGIYELAPGQTISNATNQPPVFQTNLAGVQTFSLARFDGDRDRIYSGFALLTQDVSKGMFSWGAVHFVDDFEGVSKNQQPLPVAASRKGLQVQMVDDALALGIKHAALNFNLASLIQTEPAADGLTWKMDGQTYCFNRRYLEAQPVKRLSDAGVQVSLIVLYYLGSNAGADAFMRHTNCLVEPPNHLTAFNTATPDGLRHFKAAMEFLADYYSASDAKNGRVAGYIIGNEVNTHFEWYNMGNAASDAVVDDYLRTVRVANTAVRKASAHARVYLSLAHFWTEIAQRNSQHACGGRELLDEFARKARLGGDFDWQVAFHPYPENLFECRTWLDKTATHSFDSPKITFKNLEVLDDFFRRPEMLFQGRPRKVMLSEQGFHAANQPEGEAWQAAAYCYAYRKAAQLEVIEAFVYHRHVDNRGEGGLNLGLWTRQVESVGTPDRQRRIYDVFKAADTSQWKQAFEFALPVIGITNWDQVRQ